MIHTPSQFELFEGFEPEGARTPKLTLPVQTVGEIDMRRLCRILGITIRTAQRMMEKGILRGYRVPHVGNAWRIDYGSVVEFCDRLRVRYCISDSRARLEGIRRRYRDSELLPFPIAETIGAHEVKEALDCAIHTIAHLVESGYIIGYQLFPEKRGSLWRIHKPSLERYLASLRPQPSAKANRRRV